MFSIATSAFSKILMSIKGLLTWALHGILLFIFFSATWYWRPRWLFSENIPTWFLEWIGIQYNPATDQWTITYFLVRYALLWWIVLALVLWACLGFYGLGRVLKDGRKWWLLSLGLLVWLILLSVMRHEGQADEPIRHAAMVSQATQWIFIFLFVVLVSAVAIPKHHILVALIAGMIFQGVLGIAQVALQHEVGIRWIDESWLKIGLYLYEFPLNPQQSGTSVLQSENVRYLRAYGITPHPNLFAGSVVMGLVASLWLWLQPRLRHVALWVTVIGGWALFVTFSRASVGGYTVGLIVFAILYGFSKQRWRQWRAALPFGILILLMVGTFWLIYRPLIEVRAGVGNEGATSLEQRSVAERQIYREQAVEMIDRQPILGVGIGNFAWYSRDFFKRDGVRLQGDVVHNIYYLIAAELGILGVGLTVLVLGNASWLIVQRWQQGILSPETIVLWVGCCAWLAIGWFEHFPWTLFTHQVLFWGAMAGALLPENNSMASTSIADKVVASLKTA